ncbi:IS66 family transposase [Ningiella sp. W23]|uniref:IS66 family transposase n=1 Tax=Ningiella sp. W23 TaxID=3023715 RepID=UPI003757E44C
MKSASDTVAKPAHVPYEEYAKVCAQMTSMQQQLDWFKRQLFGRKSEKHLPDNPDQGHLFAQVNNKDVSPAPKKVVKGYTRSNKQKDDNDVNDTGLRYTDDVPTKVIDVPCPELEGEDADNYEVIGVKESHRLAQLPGSYQILIYRKNVLKHKDSGHIQSPKTPINILEGTYADVSLLAGLMVDKAVYHLPLHRQHLRMLQSGVTLSRATLINYVSQGIDLLTPIATAVLSNILTGGNISMDETPMKAGRQSSTRRSRSRTSSQPSKTMKQTYFWPMYGEQDEVAFTWSSSRGKQHAMEQLAGFNGTLLSDGYAVYSQVIDTLNHQGQTITHAACWAHTRRYFEKALDYHPKEAQYALAEIQKLYKIEAHIRKQALNAEDTVQYRLKHSEPIITALFKWIYEQRQRPELLPKDPLTKALAYAYERHHELKTYLTHAQVSIDTNHLERALRVIPMGRKNHLFCWSELGAKQLGVLHTLTVTCKLHNINPYHYLVDVLQRVSQHPAKDVIDLTPRRWKVLFADKRLRSDIEK